MDSSMRSSVTTVPTSPKPNMKPGATRSNLLASARIDRFAGDLPHGPVDGDLAHLLGHEARTEVDGGGTHEDGIRSQVVQRLLGEMTAHAVHAAEHHAADDDELDAGGIEQGIGHVEGIGDDGQVPSTQASRHLQHGRPARERDRGAVFHERGRRLAHDALARDLGVITLRDAPQVTFGDGGPAVGADDPTFPRKALEGAPNGRFGHVQ